jgi:RHS repeat-associated protein
MPVTARRPPARQAPPGMARHAQHPINSCNCIFHSLKPIYNKHYRHILFIKLSPANSHDRLQCLGYHGGSVWRYDKCGNRIEQTSQDEAGRYRRQKLGYDGAHQLTAVQVECIDQQGNVIKISQSSYIYDALGRRLKKTVKDQNGKEHTSYFGWDGDRLVRTERMKGDGTRNITQTVYESGNSFTPLIRLSTTVKGDPQAKPYLMVQAAQAVMPGQQKDNPSTTNALQGLQGAMAGMPEAARQMMEQSMKQALGGGLSQMSKSILRGIGIDPDSLIANMNRGIQEEKQREQTPIDIHFYHCDHLGTPLALTDRQGHIVWAAKHDPWGNLQEEFNPHGIEQDIRLPGQHLDRETGLYYNRYRYYNPFIGAYINQDPIGLRGGKNFYSYPANPMEFVDPRGLDATATQNGGAVTINVPIKVSGQINEAGANQMASEATAIWNHKNVTFLDKLKNIFSISNPWKYGKCTVNINITASTQGTASNNIVMGNPNPYRSYVNGVGENSGTWDPNEPNLGWTAAHESGHLMGLDDQYKKPNGVYTINPGWERNIMSTYGGKAEQKNIDMIAEGLLSENDHKACKCGTF